MSERNIIIRFFAAIWVALNGLRKVLHLLLLVFLFLVFFGAISGGSTQLLPQRAALVIQPVGALVEQLDGDPYDRAIAELLGEAPPQTLVQDIVDALDYARDDDRIEAVHLELSTLATGGLSKLQRVAAAIDAFRESGKPVIASGDFFTQQGYYLASHADQIYMHPEGILYLPGYGAYRTYYKDAIDYLKLDWNVFRVGTHKSAVEPFMRMDMSPEDRDSRQRLADRLWGMYSSEVVAARGLEEGAIDDYADNLVAHVAAADGDISEAALELGLVDQLLGHTELRDLLKEYVGPDSDDEAMYSAVAMGEYLRHVSLLRGDRPKDRNVAVIVASGSILDGSQAPGTIGGDSTAALLRRALNDDSVKSVVLRVDSPGGSVFASEVISQEIEALQAAGKPVVASMSSVAASGGYWISVVADRIIASPSTITGSIGIFGMFPTYQRTLRTLGMATDGVGTTPWSGELRPDREMGEQTKQLFQMVIEDGYRDFITGVAEHRKLETDYVDEIGQGQVWTGREALDNGLVDQLGSFDDAVEVAAELAGLGGESYGKKWIEQLLTPTQQLILDLLEMTARFGIDPAVFAGTPTPIEAFTNRLQAMLAGLSQFNDPKGVYSHCLCGFD